MRRTAVIITVAILALLALAAIHIRHQPKGFARIIRTGENVSLKASPLAWAPRYLGASCVAPTRDGLPEFTRTIELEDASGQLYPADVNFGYRPPDRLARGWPEGDWCDTLEETVTRLLSGWASTKKGAEIISDPRSAGVEAANELGRRLSAEGLSLVHTTVRLKVSDKQISTRPVPEIARRAHGERPVIFIGLDGADWDLLDEYMQAGAMPNLATLVREGYGGVLETQVPPLSPLVWNTMMSGHSPLDHEILDFTRFNPQSGRKEPITSDERQVPAIWNIETWAGKSVAAMGLWATYPAEPVNGLLVSDRLFTFLFTESAPPPGIVYPPGREGWAREALTSVEKRTGFLEVKRYLPWLTEEEFKERTAGKDPYAHPVSALHRILVETAVYHQLATSYLANHTPDLTIVYFQGTDSIGHVFAPFAPPRQPEISADDYAKYHDVAEKYFRHVDSLLGEYMKIAAARDAVVFVASDHGFRWHEGRPTELSSFAAATAAKWHREEGIYLLWGPGITPSPGHPGKGGVGQVCATMLSLTGLPPGQDIEGPPLPGAPRSSAEPLSYTAFFKPHQPAATAQSTESSDEELAKLRALGYIGSGESLTAAPGSVEKGSTRTAGWYNNKAVILRGERKTEDAIEAWETAIRIDPNLASALWNLSDTLHQQKRNLDRSDALLVKAMANGLPRGVSYVIGRAIGYQRTGYEERSLSLMDSAVHANPGDAELRMFRGRYLVGQNRCEEALADFLAAQQMEPGNPAAYSSAGLAALCKGDISVARAQLERSLSMNPNQPQVRRMLAELSR